MLLCVRPSGSVVVRPYVGIIVALELHKPETKAWNSIPTKAWNSIPTKKKGSEKVDKARVKTDILEQILLFKLYVGVLKL